MPTSAADSTQDIPQPQESDTPRLQSLSAISWGPPKPRLWLATGGGDLAATRQLLAYGEDVNQVFEEYTTLWTSLVIAARGGHLPVVKYLLEAGAYVNFKGPTAVVAPVVEVI